MCSHKHVFQLSYPVALVKTEKDTGNEDEREELQAYDIDEILKRAETREETSRLTAGEELLSQFKVANFSTIEDDPILPNSSGLAAGGGGLVTDSTTTSERAWSEIIPEEERRRLEVEEENEKLKILCVDTSRRHHKKTTTSDSTPGRNKSKSSSRQHHSSDDEAASNDYNDSQADDDDDDDNDDESDVHRKRGKSKQLATHEYSFKGLNAQEIRRFVRSYRKFPCPLAKIDVIAQDAHLEEKSQACLIDFAKKMHAACQSALEAVDATATNLEDLNGT